MLRRIGQTVKLNETPQRDSDPVDPQSETAWIIKSGLTYQFSYRTKENTTVRVAVV